MSRSPPLGHLLLLLFILVCVACSLSTKPNRSRPLHRFKSFIESNENIISELEVLSSKMAKHDRLVDVAKVIKTTVNVVGVSAAVACTFFNPVALLGGVSLGTIFVVGTAIDVVTYQVDEIETKKCMKKIQSILQEFDNEFQAIFITVQGLADQIFAEMSQSRCSFDAAIAVIMSTNANVGVIRSNLDKPIEKDGIEAILGITKYVALPSLIKAISKDGASVANFCQKLSLHSMPAALGKASGQIAEKVGEVSKKYVKPIVVVNVVLQVFEVIATIRSFMSEHPTCEVINEAVRKLKIVKKECENVLEELELAREEGLKKNPSHEHVVIGAQFRQ